MFEPNRIALLQLGSFLVLAVTYQLPAPSLGAELDLVRPLVGSSIVNHYRAPETPYSSGHRGVDYAVELGQGVFAPADGQVHFSGKVVDRQLISIAHSDDLLSTFEPVCSALGAGESISRGQLIGEVCEADETYQPHCDQLYCMHFSIRKNGAYLSPMWFTGELAPSRLLPWIEPDQSLTTPACEL